MIEIQKIGRRYYKECPECKEMQSYSRLSYAKSSLKLNKTCKKCSNRKTENCHRGYYECIPITWFNKNKFSAESRNIEFKINIQEVYDLYIQQNKKCALSGVELYWESFGSSHIISIDRIDSDKGYKLDNVQLVHKDLNFMKQSFSQEYFIEMCFNVSKKWKKGS